MFAARSLAKLPSGNPDVPRYSTSIHASASVNVTLSVSTGTVTVTIEQSDDGSTYAALSGPSIAYTDADDNKLAVIDVRNHTKRYLRCVVVKATANGTIDSAVAVRYNLRNTPNTADSTVIEIDKA